MELGISSWLFEEEFGKEKLIKVLPILKECGFSAIELFCSHYCDLNDRQLRALSKEIEKLKMRVWSLHACHGVFSASIKAESNIEKVKRNIDAAKVFNAETIVIHAGGGNMNESIRHDYLSHSKENLEEILEYCVKMGIKLSMENVLPEMIGGSISELLTIVNQVPSEYSGICFDTSHAEITEKNLFDSLRLCKGKLFTVHVSDNDERDRRNYWSMSHYDKNSTGYCGEHLIPGEGKIDWRLLISVLNEIGYNGVFILEIFEVKKPFNTIQLLKRIRSNCARVGICI